MRTGRNRGASGRRLGSVSAQLFEQGTLQSPLVDAIGMAIVQGRFAAGERLPNEGVMRERYGVSRTALREAYSKLTAKGLVVARPKVGTSVRERQHWNMLDEHVLSWHLQTVPAGEIASDLNRLRQMIEPAAAELAASTRTETDIERLYEAFDRMRRDASEQNLLVEADFAFHVAILAATHNPFISGFSALIRAAMLSVFELSWRGAEVIKEYRLEQHRLVADAIRDQAPERARDLMKQLLDDSIEDVGEALVPRKG